MAENKVEQALDTGLNVDPTTYTLAYSMVDSSRLFTFVISILLIVYGSFRSLKMERESKEKLLAFSFGSSENEDNKDGQTGVQTLDACQAVMMPLGASLSLLIMFLFFDSLQLVFAICSAILAAVAFAFLLLPMCQQLLGPCSQNNKISFGCCGRFTPAEILSFCLSSGIVCIWVVTGHWILMDALGMGLCVAFIALVRLPSLKVSTLLLIGLLVYDVFWVFFSSYIFSTNVMMKVATQPAENPIGILSKKLNLFSMASEAPKLSLPGKLIFPSMQNTGHYSMLGLGDIVMPGLLLCFVLRYDAYKRSQLNDGEQPFVAPSLTCSQKITYFHCSLIGYFLGLLTATFSSEVFQATQPALLYLVPFTLLPLLLMAYFKGDLRKMWSEPFRSLVPPKNLEV